MKKYNNINDAHSEQQRLNDLSTEDLRKEIGQPDAVCISIEGDLPFVLGVRDVNFKRIGTI